MFSGRYWGGRFWGGRYWGKVGFTAAGYFWGQRYWGNRYWGQRYWSHLDTSIPFEVTTTNTLGLSGALTLGGVGKVLDYGFTFDFAQTAGLGLSSTLAITAAINSAGEEWPFSAPLEVGPLAGVLTIAGTVTISGPISAAGYWGRRYWGQRYFAPRFWASPAAFRVAQTTGASLAGTLTTAAGISTAIGVAAGTLGLTGSLGVAAQVLISGGDVERFGGGRLMAPRASDSYEQEMREVLEMLIPAFEMGVFNG